MDLTSETQSKWVICRICLKRSYDEMVRIFDGDDLDLVTKIEECGGIVLSTAPNLPDSICNKCVILLKAASKFRLKIQRTQAELSANFLLHQTPHRENHDIQAECQEFITINKPESPEGGHDKATNTEFIIPDDTTVAEIEPLVYSVEYQDAQTDIIHVDTSNVVDDAPFEVLKHNDKLIDYVDQDMDDLELVLNVEGEKDASSFKIVPQFTTTAITRAKPTPPNKQRKRKTVHDVENVETTHICPFCGNSYLEKAKLSLHMKIHTQEKPHQCEICLKRFGQTPQLARHMNSHTGSRPFMCKYCSSSFADPSTRIKHERIHTNERPYQCTVCDKAFSYSNVLKVHMMTHTGEKPHICKFCGKQFSQAHHKKKHERLHENTNLKLIKTDEETQDVI